MRLTVDLVQRATVRINPAKDMEISFRGFKIPAIENVGATEDQYDTIDLSDNLIRVLENFPIMHRLTSLFVCNNRITSVASGLGKALLALETLNLGRNQIKDLAELDNLAEISTLRKLVLMDNPVVRIEKYRLYVIARIPQLNVLDFRKIKLQERKDARRAFPNLAPIVSKTVAPTVASTLVTTETKPSTFEVGDAHAGSSLSAEERRRAKEAIANAKSLDEVMQIERSLQGGVIPPPLPNRS